MAFACVKQSANPESLTSPAPKKPGSSRKAPKPVASSGMAVPAMFGFSSSAGRRCHISSAKKSGLHKPPATLSHAPVAPPDDSLEAARALADTGEEESAAAMLERMPSSADPDFFCLRGVVSGALGRTDLAEADYRKALYLDPNHPEALAHLSLLLDLDGRAAAAAQLRRRINNIPA